MNDDARRYAEIFEPVREARREIVALRQERGRHLATLAYYLEQSLAAELEALDPMTGESFAELSERGDVAQGSYAVTLEFAEQYRFTAAVDGAGRFAVYMEPPPFGDGTDVVGLSMSDDARTGSFEAVGRDGSPARQIPIEQLFEAYFRSIAGLLSAGG